MAKFIYISKMPDNDTQDHSLVRLVNIDQIEDIFVNEDSEIVIVFASGRQMVTDENWNDLEQKLGGATHSSDV